MEYDEVHMQCKVWGTEETEFSHLSFVAILMMACFMMNIDSLGVYLANQSV